MRKRLGMLAAAAAAATFAFGAPAQAGSVKDIMVDLAAQAGLKGKLATFDFNDMSVATLADIDESEGVSVGDVLTGMFTIESISIRNPGGFTALASTTLVNTDVDLAGVYQIKVTGIDGGVFTYGAAGLDLGTDMFRLYEDSRTTGTIASLVGKTGSDTFAAGGDAFRDGTLFAALDIDSEDDYYMTQVLANGSSAILPYLNIASGGILDAILGVTGNASGTGTITPTGSSFDFTDRASFEVNAVVVPLPSAALSGLMFMGMGVAGYIRRRRMAGA